MTKNELIDLLSAIPGNSEVVVDGYEGGLRSISDSFVYLDLTILSTNPKLKWYEGEHTAIDSSIDIDEVRTLIDGNPEAKVAEVIRISRAGQHQAGYHPIDPEAESAVRADLKVRLARGGR